MNPMFLLGDDSGYISSDTESIDSVCSDASSSKSVTLVSERKLEIVFEVSDLIVVEEYNNKNSSVVAVKGFAGSCNGYCSDSQGSTYATPCVHTKSERSRQRYENKDGKDEHEGTNDEDGNCDSNYEYQQMSDLRPMKCLSPSSNGCEESIETERIELELVVQDDISFPRSNKPLKRSSCPLNQDSTTTDPPSDYTNHAYVSDYLTFHSRKSDSSKEVPKQLKCMLPKSNEERKEKNILRSDSYEECDNSGYVSSISSSSDISDYDESPTTYLDEELSSTAFDESHSMKNRFNSITRANSCFTRSLKSVEKYGNEISSRINHLMIDKTNSFKSYQPKNSSLRKNLHLVVKKDKMQTNKMNIGVEESGYISPAESSSECNSSGSDTMENTQFFRDKPTYTAQAAVSHTRYSFRSRSDSEYFSSASDEDPKSLLQTKPKYNKKQEGTFSYKKTNRRGQALNNMNADTSYISSASDEENYFNGDYS